MAAFFFGKSNFKFYLKEINFIIHKMQIFKLKVGRILFYIAMTLYLYGDLAIYDAAVPKSLRDTTW